MSIPNAAAKRREGEIHSEGSGAVLYIKYRVDFDEVHADELACFGDQLTGEMGFTLSQSSGDRSPYTGSMLRVE